MKNAKPLAIFAVSFSLACLLFVRAFRYLLHPVFHGYYEYEAPRLEFVTLFLCVAAVTLVFASILFAVEFVTNRAGKIFLQSLFLVLGLACFMGLNDEILNWLIEERAKSLNYELPLLILAIAFLGALKSGFSFENVFNKFLSITSIFIFYGIFLFANSLWVMSGFGGYDLSPQVVENPELNSSVPNRVVWLVFDELEYATAMNRPRQFQMPEYERLLNESFVGEKAFPTNFWTKQALPSLLAGRIATASEPTSPKNLNLTFLDDRSGTLSDDGNIFTKVKASGGTTGVVGWVHPYTRLFQNSLDRGYWVGAQVVRCDGIFNCMPELFSDAFESWPIANPFAENKRTNKLGRLNDHRFMEGQLRRAPLLQERALDLAADERLNFVFVHLSIPHARFVKRDLSPSTVGYFDSLEAVDETLVSVRKQLEAKGIWDSTSLIVSGDHWWRFKTNEYLSYLPEAKRNEVMQDQRVPFIVKLAGRSERFVYSEQFNTVATQNIVLGLLSGEIKSGADIANRIEKLRQERPLEINHIPKRERPMDDVFERNSGGFVADPSWTAR
jgi:hypothetical protein